jgi:hypothetical protein
MTSRKHQSKRNPLVRFIRGVLRLFRVIFAPKKRQIGSLPYKQIDLPQVELDRRQPTSDLAQRQPKLELSQPELDLRSAGQFITVGELFEQIKWQLPSETVVRAEISEPSTSQPYDVSRN